MKFPSLLFLVAILACSLSVAADDHHHFDPSEKLGTVSFATSCSPAVQKPFERGVALLHSFAYEEANIQFQEIEQQDPRCAIAYWGEAMTLYHELWSRVSKDDLKRGWELLKRAHDIKAKTKRERDYINALSAFYRDPEKPEYEKRTRDYASAMQKVYQKYPGDHEAAIFYALSLLSSSNGMEQARKAVSILNAFFEQQPDHPGVAHYLIHACDKPQLASEGLAAARRYASIAPSAPHALHMPSHIFIRLGLWQDDINSNLAAIAAADKQAAMHLHTAHNRIHSMDYLEYAYLQIGDDAKAQAMIGELGKIKREDLEPEFQSYFNAMRALFPAHYALETRQWKAALTLQAIPDAEPRNRALTFWAQAIAAGHLHDAQAARQAVEQYDAMVTATEKSDKPYAAKGMKT
ncbi:MAG TPA: hypothetical protein VJA94_01585, partial [Candidatus Angelobacter sp.]